MIKRTMVRYKTVVSLQELFVAPSSGIGYSLFWYVEGISIGDTFVLVWLA
jgi:hypothetical protein